LDTTCKENASLQITQDNKKTTDQKAEGTKEDHWRDSCICKNETGQQIAQLHGSYTMMILFSAFVGWCVN